MDPERQCAGALGALIRWPAHGSTGWPPSTQRRSLARVASGCVRPSSGAPAATHFPHAAPRACLFVPPVHRVPCSFSEHADGPPRPTHCAPHRYDFATVHPAAKGIGSATDTFMYGQELLGLLLFWGDVAAMRAGAAKVVDAHRRVLARVREGAATARARRVQCVAAGGPTLQRSLTISGSYTRGVRAAGARTCAASARGGRRAALPPPDASALSSGRRVAQAGWTALMCASANGHTAVAEVLLAEGADVHAKNNVRAPPMRPRAAH